MAKKGTPRQTLVRITAGMARTGLESQATRSVITPIRIRTSFSSP